MDDWCFYGEEPHIVEPEPEPMVCWECGAPEEELSVYNPYEYRAWCSRAHRDQTRQRESKGAV